MGDAVMHHIRDDSDNDQRQCHVVGRISTAAYRFHFDAADFFFFVRIFGRVYKRCFLEIDLLLSAKVSFRRRYGAAKIVS